MARYYFDIVDGKARVDLEGVELPDLDSARNEAVEISAQLLKGRSKAFWLSRELEVLCRSEQGGPLFSLVVSAREPHQLT
jgi:hypothetical protein